MHSIVQFPDQDNDGNPTESKLDQINLADGFWDKLKKKISSWFHFSKLGMGHSMALEHMTARMRQSIPQDTKYEVAWWIRNVKRDGLYYGNFRSEADEALQAASTYAHKTSIGNLQLLRQFLEMSMRKSMNPFSYMYTFERMLNKQGKELYNLKIRKLFGESINRLFHADINFDTAIKLMMGFTRKRQLLVPEWADATELWLPKSNLLADGMSVLPTGESQISVG
jgi:hypothetical protein